MLRITGSDKRIPFSLFVVGSLVQLLGQTQMVNGNRSGANKPGVGKRQEAFAPVLGRAPKVLVLGSMPSVKSLCQQEYYAHPQNAFWFIIESLFSSSPLDSYAARLQCLRDWGIALWDVAACCEREGSLDANIVAASFEANDFATFLARYTSIEGIFFNGRSVQTLFNKHVLRKRGLGNYSGAMITLPSTSPANASMSKREKLVQWQCLYDFLTP